MRSNWLGRETIAVGLVLFAACTDGARLSRAKEPAGSPSSTQVPLDPLSIPKFAQELGVPRVFQPAVIMDGELVVRHEYTVSVKQTTVQMLPPGFPSTTVLAYGGEVKLADSPAPEFVRSVPGPVFETIRGVPAFVRWRNEIDTPHFLAVDPTLHFANPLGIESPAPPFAPFPPGYADARFPVPHVTHNHGLAVPSAFDGVAESWFTMSGIVGPSFVSMDYLMPNDQPSTQLFYHDHAMGMTRLNVYSGLLGAYFIRDPNHPLDQPNSPLPRGEYEIPLIIFDRAFFTDGELSFPRASSNPGNAHWQGGDGANVSLVNGKVWPNLNVEPRQYRFRILAAGNGRTWTLKLDHLGSVVPMTIIGSDGGYLPAPQVVPSFLLGTSERADVLVDFSSFADGTQIILLNTAGNVNTVGTVMRFTVVGTSSVAPSALPAFAPMAVLTPDAPTRVKTFHNIIDAAGNAERSTDGVDFTTPTTEFALVGSTERWDIVNLGGGSHQAHLHLIEFQVLDRHGLDAAAYQRRWLLLNGLRPVTRPIVVDPTPFFIGLPIPALPYETGWKDTVRTPPNQMTRLVARWAPQEIPSGGASPGQNLFSFDPTSGPGYVWHCHVLGHEDHDMMRKMPLVKLWAPATDYAAETVFAHEQVNYRVRVAHTSKAAEPPPTRFDRYERVNNNDGTWAPQIVYAVRDRVLFEEQLFMANQLHQAQPLETPASDPILWHPFPMTACGQLQELCAGEVDPNAIECEDVALAGSETDCLVELAQCLAKCAAHEVHGVHASPCSGLCTNPVAFSVSDGTTFASGALSKAASCHETTSKLVTGQCQSFAAGRYLTINGKEMPCNGNGSGHAWGATLPTQRNHGYCIRTNAGNSPNARFTVR